ncbi:MAG: hypothetical protein COV36_02250 [Alphaproteobacteria bacterium CG11_big_fil_rev_8_21_14_0_20_44_7]|nr:MAG: hypothetical protein COV36_02250 [Alphaproteobacteria bacterium CG11_big_fil_rev_8_21_14_0_20_44_7]
MDLVKAAYKNSWAAADYQFFANSISNGDMENMPQTLSQARQNALLYARRTARGKDDSVAEQIDQAVSFVAQFADRKGNFAPSTFWKYRLFTECEESWRDKGKDFAGGKLPDLEEFMRLPLDNAAQVHASRNTEFKLIADLAEARRPAQKPEAAQDFTGMHDTLCSIGEMVVDTIRFTKDALAR